MRWDRTNVLRRLQEVHEAWVCFQLRAPALEDLCPVADTALQGISAIDTLLCKISFIASLRNFVVSQYQVRSFPP